MVKLTSVTYGELITLIIDKETTKSRVFSWDVELQLNSKVITIVTLFTVLTNVKFSTTNASRWIHRIRRVPSTLETRI